MLNGSLWTTSPPLNFNPTLALHSRRLRDREAIQAECVEHALRLLEALQTSAGRASRDTD